ncbi:MAG TPA: CoA-binding protein [Steroidobacteraceae bacterium]
MAFVNPSTETIQSLLRRARIVAVVGLSDNPQRPSHEVATALIAHGYRVIPVNPALTAWQGIRAVPDLDHLGDVLGPGEHVDIVDVFRHPQYVGPIVADCIRLKLPVVWLQLGVVDEAAAQLAVDAGITVVMDRCMKIERMKMR